MGDYYESNGPGWGCGIIVVGLLGLLGFSAYHSATDPDEIAERARKQRYEDALNTTGVLERTMPDGTQLWHSRVHGEDVYFSQKGADWDTRHSCGKNCTRTVHHNIGNAQ